MDIESPCIRHCTLDAQDNCVGCRRSIGEIMRWTAMGVEERRAIMERLAATRAPPAGL